MLNNRRQVDVSHATPLNRINLTMLPEILFVETRIINQQTAASVNRLMHHTKLPHSTVQLVVNNNSPVASSDAKDQPVSYMTPLVASTCDASTLTDAPIPTRSRLVQTDLYTNGGEKATIGIQCNLEEENNEPEFTLPEERNVKEEFLQFVTEKADLLSNGMLECLLCGEIAKNTTTMTSHMALHWKADFLCCTCGQRFANEPLFERHACDAGRPQNRRRQVRSRSVMCPHYRCGIVAISPLELNDHINEHLDNRCYRCNACKSRFHTAGELRHHIPLRLQCLEKANCQRLIYSSLTTREQKAYRGRVFAICSAKRKRHVLVKSFLSQQQKTNRYCRICLKYCSNKLKYALHSQRCMAAFQLRLNMKRTGYYED